MENLTCMKEAMLVFKIQHFKGKVQLSDGEGYNPPHVKNQNGAKNGTYCLFFFLHLSLLKLEEFHLSVLRCNQSKHVC